MGEGGKWEEGGGTFSVYHCITPPAPTCSPVRARLFAVSLWGAAWRRPFARVKGRGWKRDTRRLSVHRHRREILSKDVERESGAIGGKRRGVGGRGEATAVVVARASPLRSTPPCWAIARCAKQKDKKRVFCELSVRYCGFYSIIRESVRCYVMLILSS